MVPASTNNLEVADTLNRTTKYIQGGGSSAATLITGIRRPTSPSTNSVTIAYDGLDRVYTVSNGVGTWTYGYSDSAGVFTTTKTDPLSNVWTYRSETDTGLLLSEKDPLNRETTYAYDEKGRMVRVVRPEGDADEYSYDVRGNVIEVRRKAKPGSGLSDLVTSTSYPSTCINAVTCHQRISTTDAAGKTTDYTYDTTHGGVLTATAPSPDGTASRPETRYSYTALYAWYKNSTGTVVQAATPVYRLTGISACSVGQGCIAAATELKTTITYGTASVANNLLPTSIAKGAGDASLTATTAMAYNQVGDVVSVDGPLLGTTDAMTYRYDAGRQRIGLTTPDPDGATATLKHRATRYTYNVDGQITLAEQGTVNSRSDVDWAAFSSLTRNAYTYDSVGRVTKATVESGGTTYAVTQYSYDGANRVDCVAVRMNSFTSLPTSACTLSTAGANGFDRISKNSYDVAGQLVRVINGYGTAGQRDEASASYTANGQQATLIDANRNLTTFQYDGFDRPWRTFYPDPDNSMTSSAADYEQVSYDTAGRVSQERRRDGSVFGVNYDYLSRPTTIDAPSGMLDVTYTYDNFGRVLTAAQASHTVTWNYDVLGRKLSEVGPLTVSGAYGKIGYEYDLAGRRTKLTWPDGFFVTYTYDDAGYPKNIRQGGLTASTYNLATFSYTNLGALKSITRANTAGTSYGHDNIGRPTSLVQNLLGTIDDVTYTLTWSPASQIKSRVDTNANYALATPTPVNRSYDINGRNQIEKVGVSPNDLTLAYDSNGNLTSDGVNNYSHDQANRLTGMPGLVNLSYDPSGRLFQAGAATKFLYDGSNIIAEYADDEETVLRKYVHGPVVGQPLVWLEGADASTRRWLITDQLGSIVAVTNDIGAAVAVNKYDEYGSPSSGNAGRFQYTGQAWFSEIGLYHYKSRMYSPTLGRFMEPDPRLFVDGGNMYNYSGSDPVNRTDPNGTEWIETSWCQGREDTTTDETVHIMCTRQVGMIWVPDWLFGGPLSPPPENLGPGGPGGVSGELPACPKYITINFGYSATAFVAVAGLNGGVNGQVNIPLNFDWRQIQVGANVQAGWLVGLGAYVGYGGQVGPGYSDQPMTSGQGDFLQAEANAGWYESVGVSGQISVDKNGRPTGVGGGKGAGKVGGGFGGMVGVGKGAQRTFTFRPSCKARG